MNSSANDIVANLAQVRDRMERAAMRAGRRPDEVTLVAVSKKHSVAAIEQLFDNGVQHFGESRVQEWEAKRPCLAGLPAIWHMIGHIQSNKASRAVRLFDTIDTVDSVALAERLAKAQEAFNAECDASENSDSGSRRQLSVLIEVKLDPEPAKSGVDPLDLPHLVDAVMLLSSLEFRGLFGVPPYDDAAEKARPYFRRLRDLRDQVHAQVGRELQPVLSMGMSQDFEIAIEEGATEIRVGTALFGER